MMKLVSEESPCRSRKETPAVAEKTPLLSGAPVAFHSADTTPTMYCLRTAAPLLVRRLSQAVQPSRHPYASSSSTPALSDPHAALHRTKLVHRQSSKWRSSPSAGSFTPSHEPRTSPAPASPSAESRSARLLLSYHDLERALERRGLNTARVLLLGASAVGVGVFLAWPRIKQWGAVEGAEVAAASLETEQLQERAVVMLHEVLADERTGRQVESLLKDAVTGLFRDEDFTGRAVEWSAKVMAEALTWEEVRQQGTDYLKSVFDDHASQKSAELYLTGAIQNVVADEGVQDTVAQSLWSSVRASIIGRRKPREEPTPAEKSHLMPGVEQEQIVPQKEAVYASSTLDESDESDARPERSAGPAVKLERGNDSVGKEAKSGAGADLG